MFITRRIPSFLLALDEPAGGGGTPPEEGAPTPPEGTGTQAPSENWEDRYKDAQAWGTRLAQERAELEAEAQIARALRSDDPQQQRQALEALGYQVPDEPEDTPPNGLDPQIAAKLAKVDELEQWRNSTVEEQTREQNYAQYRAMTDPQLEGMGVPDGLRDMVAEVALDLPPLQTPQGPRPDLAAAMQQVEAMAEHFAALPAVQTAVKKSWKNTKPSAAFTSPGGAEGTQVPDLTDREARQQYQLARFQSDRQQ